MNFLSQILKRILAEPKANYIPGIDVSHHNGVINWPQVGMSDVKFAYIKMTEGTTWRDQRGAANWAGVKATSILRGPYHYYRPHMDRQQQAQNLYDAAPDTQLPPCLDVELSQAPGYELDRAYYRDTPKAQIQADLLDMLQKIEALYGRKPIIYTADWFWRPYVGIAPWMLDYDLFVADYDGNTPVVPLPWTYRNWRMWQYTATGRTPGISGNVDLDYFNGSLSGLYQWAGVEQPGVIGQARVLGSGLRIRKTPWGTIIGSLPKDAIVDVYEIQQIDTWAKIGPDQYVCVQNKGTQFLEWVEEPEPFEIDSPVGTPEERASGQIWPGNWFSAYGYLADGKHTGVDLNNNVPWDADAHAPVYSVADNGVVVYAAIAPGTWGGVIVIRYQIGDLVFWVRYGHVENILVNVGDEVYRGQQVANIGQYFGDPHNYHLHLDFADNTLQNDPLNWPGYNPAFIAAHYFDPAPFIRNNRHNI